MKLSAPIYQLKRKAKLLSRAKKIPLHEALDRVACDEGIRRWSLLSARASAASAAGKLYKRLKPGDLVLIGARPHQGKTLMCLEILIEAMKAGNRGVFFTLEYLEKDVKDLFRRIGSDLAEFQGRFELETSDAISADFIAKRLDSAPSGTVAVVDYLQLLDQRRDKPGLPEQICRLKAFARIKGVVILFLSQIDRAYDPATKPCPDLDDVRLPNPLNLKLFNKSCFLQEGEMEFRITP